MNLSPKHVARIHPWRRPSRAPATLSVPELYATLTEALERTRGSGPERDAVIARYRAGAAPGPLDLSIESAAAMLIGEPMVPTRAITGTGLLVDLWVALEGPAFALRALLAYEGPEDPPLDDSAGPQPVRYFTSGVVGPWRRLRERLTASTDAEYDRARSVAAELRRDLDIGRRCALSYLFPLVTAWAAEDAAAYEPDRSHRVRAPALAALVSCTDDLETIRAILEKDRAARGSALANDHIFTAIDRVGPAILELHAQFWDHSTLGLTEAQTRQILLDAYDGLQGLAVARAVTDFLADATVARSTRALLGRDPESAIIVLAERVGRSARRGKALEIALAGFATVYPAEAEAALGALNEPARGALAAWASEADLFPPKKRGKTAARPAPAEPWVDVAARSAPAGVSPEELDEIVRVLSRSRAGEYLARAAVLPAERIGASFEALAWALVDAWEARHGPVADAWVLRALVALVDPGAAKRVAQRVRAWASAGATRAALLLLGALSRLDDPNAVVELPRLTATGPELRAAAELHVERILRERGWTEEDLHDRLTPTCGLASGDGVAPVVLDFGTARLEVRFDEHLEPYLVDETGGRVKNPPRPTRGANAERAAEARERWTEIKQTLRATLAAETRRLEEAMCTRRRFGAASFTEAIVGHPVLRRLAQRLVWLDEGRDPRATFRVAEDGSLADAADAVCEARGPIRLLHALDATEEERAAWTAVFRDYELLEPFPQIAREVYTLDPSAAGAFDLAAYAGVPVNPKATFMLESRGWTVSGWEWGDPSAERVFDGTRGVTLTFRGVGSLEIDRVEATDELGAFDPIAMSELLRDLERIRVRKA
ncbi:MAG: DUF4132 domain-containing protein [Polyangiaceae bacterium]